MTTTRNTCGYRDGVDAHRAAGEPLCGPCRASAAKRARIRASKRHARPDDDEDGYTDLGSINADLWREAMRTGEHGR